VDVDEVVCDAGGRAGERDERMEGSVGLAGAQQSEVAEAAVHGHVEHGARYGLVEPGVEVLVDEHLVLLGGQVNDKALEVDGDCARLERRRAGDVELDVEGEAEGVQGGGDLAVGAGDEGFAARAAAVDKGAEGVEENADKLRAVGVHVGDDVGVPHGVEVAVDVEEDVDGARVLVVDDLVEAGRVGRVASGGLDVVVEGLERLEEREGLADAGVLANVHEAVLVGHVNEGFGHRVFAVEPRNGRHRYKIDVGQGQGWGGR
jgi:hypothetical protein